MTLSQSQLMPRNGQSCEVRTLQNFLLDLIKIGAWASPESSFDQIGACDCKPRPSALPPRILKSDCGESAFQNFSSLTVAAIKDLECEDLLERYLFETDSEDLTIQEKMIRDNGGGKRVTVKRKLIKGSVRGYQTMIESLPDVENCERSLIANKHRLEMYDPDIRRIQLSAFELKISKKTEIRNKSNKSSLAQSREQNFPGKSKKRN